MPVYLDHNAISPMPISGLEIGQPGHYLRQPGELFESRLARGIDANLAGNAIRVSLGIENSLQGIEALNVNLVNKMPAVIRQAAA